MRLSLPLLVALSVVATSCHRYEEEFSPGAEPEGTSDLPVGDSEVVETDASGYEIHTFNGIPFRLLRPKDPDPARNYPMVVFLHGIGERGSDNEQQLTVGGAFFSNDSTREKYPAFVVFPQCPADAYWFDNDIVLQVKALIDTLQQQYAVNKEMVSIGGFSMGAYGTFEIASRYPGLFEAAFAIAGDGDESKATLMAGSRWRIFAGANDGIVPSVKSRRMADALASAGASVSFTLYPYADHRNTWVYAFSEPDLCQWLFAVNSSAAGNR